MNCSTEMTVMNGADMTGAGFSTMRYGASMKRFLVGVLPLMAFLVASSAFGETIRLSTLEWPPFVGLELSGQGVVSERVRKICTAAGMRLELSFTPWKRALLEAGTGLSHGYFPEYRSAIREKDFYFSEPVGCSVVGLVRRSDVTLDWTRLEDLAAYRIGVVDGYVNTEEFDRLVDTGVLKTVKSNSDVLSLRMLEAGRTDAVVMDRAVFKHLSAKGEIPEVTSRLVFDTKILAVHSLHVCFPRTSEGKALAERFDHAVSSGGFTLKCASEFEAPR